MLRKDGKHKNKGKKVRFNLDSLFIRDEFNKDGTKRPKSVEKSISSHKLSPKKKSNNSENELDKIQIKTKIEDFEIMSVLGTGIYDEIKLVKHKENKKKYAVKIINKKKIDSFNLQHEAIIEKICLSTFEHPNIVEFNRAFQDKKNLYLMLEYCKNKNLEELMKLLGPLDFHLAQYYSAEILLAILYMHKKGFYHRDINPKNIGIDENMHLKLLDFGTADSINKFFDKKTMKFVDIQMSKREIENLVSEKGSTDEKYIQISKYNIVLLSHKMIGSIEYISPEVLEQRYSRIGPMVDIWALGIIIYLLFTGKTPFKGKNDEITKDNIIKINYNFDEKDNIPEEAKDLIKKILVKDPTKRIGYKCKDCQEIKNHPFFKGIEFDILEGEPVPLGEKLFILENKGYISNKKEERNDLNSLEYPNILCKDQEQFSLGNKGDKYEDHIIIEDTLEKKSPYLHYNLRIVKFFSKGHIDYFDPSTKNKKGSFIIDEACGINLADDRKLEIITPNRTFIFKHDDKNVINKWFERISSFISCCKGEIKSIGNK